MADSTVASALVADTADSDLHMADQIGMAMMRLFRMSALAQSKASTHSGLDRSAFILLAALARRGPCRSNVLAEAVFVDPSTVSRQVAGLVKKGLVQRQSDALDGRASLLAVTDAGKLLLDKHRSLRNSSIASVVAEWSAADREKFVELFERFTVDYEHALPALLEAGIAEQHQP